MKSSASDTEREPILLTSVRDIKMYRNLYPDALIRGKIQGIVTKVTPMGGVVFLTVYDGTDFIQLIAEKDRFSEEDWHVVREFKRYARVNVTAEVGVSRRGEVSLLLDACPAQTPELGLEELYLKDGDLGHVGAQLFLARLRSKAASFFLTEDFVEIEPNLLSTIWDSRGLVPLRADYPGFGTPAYLVPSPSPQLLRALIATGKSRVFCVSRCFTTTYREAAASYESLILCAKEIGCSIERMQDLASCAIHTILSDIPTMPIEPVHLSTPWSRTELDWPPNSADLHVTSPEIQVFNDYSDADPALKGRNIRLFRHCWPPNAVLAEGHVESLDGGVVLGSVTVHIERMVLLMRTDASLRLMRPEGVAVR